MQQLLSELYKQTSIQSTLTWSSWGLLLFGLFYVRIYISEHQFEEKNWKYVFKMLIPIIITLCLSLYSSFDNHQSFAKVKDPNTENYEIKKDDYTIHFVSKNKNLKGADLNIVSENDKYIYLSYNNKVIEVKKDELKLNN